MLKIPNQFKTPSLFALLTFVASVSVIASDVPNDPLALDLQYIHQKAKSGQPYYQAYLGIIYRIGYKNVVISYDKSLYWTKLSIEKNHPLALGNMGAIRLWEIDRIKDLIEKKKKSIEALHFYEDAHFNGLERLANYGDPIAADLLADYYFVSRLPSSHKLEKYLKIGVDKGYPRSLAALGVLQMTGEGGIQKDKKLGIFHIEKAAAQYLPEALLNLGHAYFRGDVVPQSKEKAMLLYREASRRGFSRADNILKKIEEEGGSLTVGEQPPSNTRATPQRPVKPPSPTPTKPKALPVPQATKTTPTGGDTASGWRTRAYKGDAIAQRQVGLMYWLGKGVEKDLGKAKYWLEKAAQQGDELAQKRLKLLNKIL